MTTDAGQRPVRGGARELARRAMTAQIADMALDLFLERGYDATTVEDICAAAGIGRTSFFRYFKSKEDVLMRDFAAMDTLILEELRRRPDSESAWTALGHAIKPLAAQYTSADVRFRQGLRLVIETPSLGAVHRDKLEAWSRTLRPEISRRLGVAADDGTDPAAKAVLGAAFACLDASLEAWLAAEGTENLQELFERAVAALGRTAG